MRLRAHRRADGLRRRGRRDGSSGLGRARRREEGSRRDDLCGRKGLPLHLARGRRRRAHSGHHGGNGHDEHGLPDWRTPAGPTRPVHHDHPRRVLRWPHVEGVRLRHRDPGERRGDGGIRAAGARGGDGRKSDARRDRRLADARQGHGPGRSVRRRRTGLLPARAPGAFVSSEQRRRAPEGRSDGRPCRPEARRRALGAARTRSGRVRHAQARRPHLRPGQRARTQTVLRREPHHGVRPTRRASRRRAGKQSHAARGRDGPRGMREGNGVHLPV